jgi:hypothetical protein
LTGRGSLLYHKKCDYRIDLNATTEKSDGRDPTRFNSHPANPSLLETSAKTDIEGATVACAFCNIEIPFGHSVCPDCIKKYNITSYDLGSDGCGCDS